MQKLKLNFNQMPDQPPRLAGWLLLLAGVFLLGEMSFSYIKLQRERSELNKEIVTYKIHLDMSHKETPRQQYAEADFDEAKKIIKRLSTPWESFIKGLESISSKKVAVLSIEPDMQAGLLRLEGEAKDYPSVLTFITQLRETKPFSKVFLSRHEYKRDDPQHPVVFTISMHWVKTS
jgi:Tfp pilus assembly protein PilN